jgi:predicted alpha/beta superfamily hydrolase
MKKILSFGGVIVVTSLASIGLFDYFRSGPPYPENVIQTKLYSAILAQERELIIHLPRDYDAKKKYPVMYVLDGSSEDMHIANKLDILSEAGYTPRTIVVGIPNMSAENRQRNLTPPFMRMDAEQTDSPPGGGDQFLSFMESELFPFVEKNHAASDVRLFSGHSRGGLLVMYSLIYKPSLFNARLCYSTPLWRQDNILISEVKDFLDSHDTLNTFLYMSAGENETDNIKGGMEKMKENLMERSPAGLTWYADLTPNAVHQNNSKISATRGIVRWSEYFKAIYQQRMKATPD